MKSLGIFFFFKNYRYQDRIQVIQIWLFAILFQDDKILKLSHMILITGTERWESVCLKGLLKEDKHMVCTVHAMCSVSSVVPSIQQSPEYQHELLILATQEQHPEQNCFLVMRKTEVSWKKGRNMAVGEGKETRSKEDIIWVVSVDLRDCKKGLNSSLQ